MPPTAAGHGGSQTRFASALFVQGQQRGHGECFSDTGVILRRHPDSLVGPDVAFVATASLPARLTKEGYLETIPDLIVEIRSKNDTMPEVLAKVQEYLGAGARVVWVADPDALTVTEYRRNQSPKVFQADDTLAVDDVIPGFALKVRDGFR
jgi:Uma2 family endonuclease